VSREAVPVEEYVTSVVEDLLKRFAAEMSHLSPGLRVSSVHRERHMVLVTLGDGSVCAVRVESLQDGEKGDGSASLPLAGC
jgi:hypothetical protein